MSKEETESEDNKAAETETEETKSAENKKEETKTPEDGKKEAETDEDLYSDEVYKESEDPENDMVYIDLSNEGADETALTEKTDQKKEKKVRKKEAKKLKEKKDIDYFGIIVTWLLVIIGGAVYISLTFNENVWLDEAFTASLVNADMTEVIKRSMADTLPPLYNILLKLSTDFFGYTVPVMKTTSAVPMILTMMLGATVVRKRYGTLTASVFILALIVMPNMFFYGVEIRMYSLGFLFATAAGIFAGEVINKGNPFSWIMLTLSTVLAGYSHHFAFVTAGLTYLFILIYACYELKEYNEDEEDNKQTVRLSSFVLCLVSTIILYLPCFLITLKQLDSVSGYFSMPDVTLSVFVKYCRYPFTTGFTPLSIILLALTVFLFVVALFKKDKTAGDFFSIYCFVIYYIVLIFGTLVSKIMTANIFVDRYLFFSLGLLWLFFSIETAYMKKWAAYLIVILEIVIGIYSYNLAYTNEYAPGIDELKGWLKDNVTEGDSLYTLEESEELAFCLPFYDSDLTNYEDLKEAVDKAGDNHVWVALLNDYDGSEGYDSDIKDIKDSGYDIEYISEFRFDRYMFKMYKLKE